MVVPAPVGTWLVNHQPIPLSSKQQCCTATRLLACNTMPDVWQTAAEVNIVRASPPGLSRTSMAATAARGTARGNGSNSYTKARLEPGRAKSCVVADLGPPHFCLPPRSTGIGRHWCLSPAQLALVIGRSSLRIQLRVPITARWVGEQRLLARTEAIGLQGVSAPCSSTAAPIKAGQSSNTLIRHNGVHTPALHQDASLPSQPAHLLHSNHRTV